MLWLIWKYKIKSILQVFYQINIFLKFLFFFKENRIKEEEDGDGDVNGPCHGLKFGLENY